MNDLIKNQYGPTFFKRWGEIFGVVFIALRSALGIRVFLLLLAVIPDLVMGQASGGVELSSVPNEVVWGFDVYSTNVATGETESDAQRQEFQDIYSAAKAGCEVSLAFAKARQLWYENYLIELQIELGNSQSVANHTGSDSFRTKSCNLGEISRSSYSVDEPFRYKATILWELEGFSDLVQTIVSAIKPFEIQGTCPTCYVAKLPNFTPSEPKICESAAQGEPNQHESVDFAGTRIDFSLAPTDTNNSTVGTANSDVLVFNSNDSFLDKSSGYATEEEACEEGFAELKSRATVSWLSEMSVQYSLGSCDLKRGSETIGILPIASALEDKPRVHAIQLRSADGSVTNFFPQYYGGRYFSFGNTRTSISGSKQEATDTTASRTWTLSSDEGNKTFNTAGSLVNAQNALGQNFVYQSSNGSSTIQAPNGETLEFKYDGGRLAQLVQPDKSTRSYNYEDSRYPDHLTSITNERGVKSESWQYDARGRVVLHERAGGADRTTTSFNADGSKTDTNSLGKKTTFYFTEVAGTQKVSRVTGEPTSTCVGSNQAYTYTKTGLLETQTAWNGTVTHFVYDSFNRETTRTQGEGTPQESTVQTCYDGNSTRPVRIIEPTRVTILQYNYSNQLKTLVVKPRPSGSVDCTTTL